MPSLSLLFTLFAFFISAGQAAETKSMHEELATPYKKAVAAAVESVPDPTKEECAIRIEETEFFTIYYRGDRVALKKRKENGVYYLFGPKDIFAVGFSQSIASHRTPRIQIEENTNLPIEIEALPDKSWKVMVVDSDGTVEPEKEFYEEFILTPTDVSLVQPTEYAERLKELRKIRAGFAEIRKELEAIQGD